MSMTLRRKLSTLLIGALLAIPLLAYAVIYSADQVEAWVIDAETGQPVDHALVVANWQLEGGVDTGIPRGQLQILETHTDPSGKFVLTGWGPKIAFRGHASWKWPQILVFKPGYRYARVMNEPPNGREAVARSEWHGKKITLTRVPDTQKYADYYRSFNGEIDWIGRTGGDACAWRRLPQALRAILAEDTRLEPLGVQRPTTGFRDSDGLRLSSSLPQTLRDSEEYFAAKGCGSARELLDGVRK